MKKIILFSLISILLLSSCNNQSINSKTDNSKKTEKSKVEGITALKAWEKVKPEAEKWDSNYKIASIREISTPSFQRIDGKSIGWKFQLEACEEEFSSGGCKKGKSRSFEYTIDDMAGQKAGLTAGQENSMPSGRSAFNSNKFKIDSDKAQEIARQFLEKQRIEDEEFTMAAYKKGDIAYWKIGRQCWYKGNNCDSKNSYSAYVNIETGEAYDKEPK